MAGRVEDQAFVTLATNDPYCYGALVLGQSLRDHGTTRQLAILVTPQVSQPMRQQLSQVYDEVRQVNPLDSHDEAHLALLTRPELGITFTKIRCWKEFTQYSKCVFLDADALVLQNVDELFERDELSAVPDVGWPDCFNSGVFVFKPSEDTYNSLLQCAVTQGSFDGGDQGLLNTFFNSWRTDDIKKHLSFVYNMTSNISYTYKPALLKFGQNIKIVHFIGTAKPWRYTYNTVTGQVSPPDDVGYGNGHQLSFVEAWWSIFMTSIKPRIEQAQGRHELASRLTQSHETAPEPSNVQTNNTTPTSSYHTGSQFTNVHTPPSTNFPSVNFGLTQPSSQQAEEASESKPSTNINLQGVDLASQMGCLKLSDGGAAGFSVNPPGSPRTRQHLWEQGQVDYMGQDKFDNIDQFIQDKINGKDKEKEKDGKEKEKVGKDKK